MDKQFMVFNVSEINLIDFNQVMETSYETLRLSTDGTKTFVKWVGDIIPQCVQSLTTSEGPYTYDEFMSILVTDEWFIPTKVLEAI
jgi:hypothetical protein